MAKIEQNTFLCTIPGSHGNNTKFVIHLGALVQRN